VRLCALVLAVAAGALAPTASAAPPLRLVELPGVEALPPEPPLAPPQPPLVETPRLRGTVSARNRVLVGIDGDGSPTRVTVVQRLEVRALGDYTFFIPAPAITVTAAPGSESQPGFRQNQILWQGFSPRRRVLAASARLRLQDSAPRLPIRLLIAGAPRRPGPFELTIAIENTTVARSSMFAAEPVEADVVAARDSLRAAARTGRAYEGRAVRVRGEARPAPVDAWSPFSLRGTIVFPAGAVRDLAPARLRRLLGRRALQVSVRGVAGRPAAPSIRLVAQPFIDAALSPASTRSFADLQRASLRYARARQYQSFLANPDPIGPSETTYVYETTRAEPAARPANKPSDDAALPVVIVLGGLALLAFGLAVLWAHS
jgi:hypothetical protein